MDRRRLSSVDGGSANKQRDRGGDSGELRKVRFSKQRVMELPCLVNGDKGLLELLNVLLRR